MKIFRCAALGVARTIGVALAIVIAAASGAHANLVVNGGFETGDFTGWTHPSDPHDSVIAAASLAHSGTYTAALGPFSFNTLSQTLVTVPGEHYDLDFFLSSRFSPFYEGAATPNEFQVYWDGVKVLDLVDEGLHEYDEHLIPVAASGASTDLTFRYFQVPTYWRLDDVSVEVAAPPAVPTPEPISLTLFGLGLSGLAVVRWRMTKRRPRQ